MARRKWTLVVFWSLVLSTLAAMTMASSTEDILGSLTNNGSSSDPIESTVMTPGRNETGTSAPATTSNTSAPLSTTTAPIKTTLPPAPTYSPPQPIKTTPKGTLATQSTMMLAPTATSPQPSQEEAKANTTAKSSMQEDEPVIMPKAVAKAKPSNNNTYVWVVACGGICTTVASVMLVSLKRRRGKTYDVPVNQAMHNADDAIVTGSMITRLRNWSIASSISIVWSAAGQSTDLFVVEESEDGDNDLHRVQEPDHQAIYNANEAIVTGSMITRLRNWSLASSISMVWSAAGQSTDLFVVDESEDGDNDTRRGMFAVRELTFSSDRSSDTPESPAFSMRSSRSASASTVQSTTSLHEFSSFHSP